MSADPNILLIVLDCVRYDGLHCLGNARAVTPRLDALAERGRVFHQARSAAVWTLPSHASLFTGLHPRQHGVNHDHRWLARHIPTLAEALSRLGYQTAAFSTNAWVGPHFGLDRGFENFYALWRIFPGMGARPFPWWEKALRKRVLERRDKGAAKLNRYVQRWWRRERDRERPFFLFALYLDAHLPYRPPRGYAEQVLDRAALRAARRANQDAWAYMAGEVEMTAEDFQGLRGLYDAEIRYVDHKLGELLDFLQEVGALENTLVIVTADHGENIGEHGLMDHQYCVYDTLARVPLILHHPALAPDSQDYAPAQLTDLFPTILHFIGRSDLITLPGRSLLDSAASRSDPAHPSDSFQVIQYTAPHRHRFARRHPHFDPASRGFDRTFDAIVMDGYKLIRSNRGEIELYDLARDAAESVNLAARQPQRAAKLAAALDAWLETHAPAASGRSGLALDDGLEQHLRALGYL
ncbi:MAG: sulfatase [Chloroflexi bacterium]|nr:sulfatase [Chloroflexota bacterium]